MGRAAGGRTGRAGCTFVLHARLSKGGAYWMRCDGRWEGAALVFAAAGCVDALRAGAHGPVLCVLVCWCVLQETM